jgi:hypothetical protein
MVDEVVADRLKPGMSSTKVRDLLGSPDQINDDETWVYWVDAEPGGFLRTCVALVLFMSDESLERAEVMRDD